MSSQSDIATILIIDDHAPAAEMLGQIFNMRGYNTVIVDNGHDAIKLANTLVPDIILLDVMMPGMDGYAVMNELRKSGVTSDIPIILVTAKDDIADIEQGLELGADDYIPKPVKPREMLARVKSKIEARRLRQDVHQRTTELEALLRFSQELNTQRDVNSLLDLILFLVLDLLDCDMAAIYHLGHQNSILSYRHQRRAQTSKIMVESEDLFNHLFKYETMILWNDNKIGGTKFPSGMAIRLEYGTQLHGLLVILSETPYQDDDSRIFETIARQTTLALRNAENYENLEEMVAQRTQELRSAEQLLVRSEKLASVGRLAAGIAHEINNPLMPIRMNLELMQEDLQNNTPISERDIEETLHSVNRISRIVARLQQFTRGRGEDLPEMEALYLSKVIDNVLQLTNTYIRHSGIQIDIHLDPDARIFGNRDQLEQVFLNITLNAQAAMEDGGILSIKTQSNPETTIVEITDTGHGIEEHMIEKIFEPFISTKETGSGLGLFISHNIIHNHSGQIEVHSEVGKGTTFIITLPTLKEERA
ncbi:MAG: response regulator [Phototrophicaceae bacterium]